MRVKAKSESREGDVLMVRIRESLTHPAVIKIFIWSFLAILPIIALGRLCDPMLHWQNPVAHCFLEIGGSFIAMGLVYCLWVEYCVTCERRVLLAMVAFGGMALGRIAHGLVSLLPDADPGFKGLLILNWYSAWQIATAVLLIIAARTKIVDDKQKSRKTSNVALFGSLIASLFGITLLINSAEYLPCIEKALSISPSSIAGMPTLVHPELIYHTLSFTVYSLAFGLFAWNFIRNEDRFSEGVTVCLLLFAVSHMTAILSLGSSDPAWWFSHVYSIGALSVLLVKLGVEFGMSYADAHARVDHLEAVHYISSRLSNTLDLRVVLLTFVTDTAKMLSARFSSIMLADEDGESLATIATYGIIDASLQPSESQKVAGRGTGFHAGHTARSFRERQICVVDDVFTDVEFVPWRLLAKYDGYSVSIPLIYHEVPLGVLNLFFEKHIPLNDERIRLFRTLAASASVAIANAQLYDKSLQYEELAIAEECLVVEPRLAS